MTRVDFYSLEEQSGGDRFLLACRLVERIHGMRGDNQGGLQEGAEDSGHRIYILVPDRQQARHLDRLLWTFRQHSFLPHALMQSLADDFERERTPILIGHDDPGEGLQVLINLGLTVPSFLGNFERLCELVDQDREVREAARKRYVHYRNGGYPLHHHKIRL